MCGKSFEFETCADSEISKEMKKKHHYRKSYADAADLLQETRVLEIYRKICTADIL